MALTKIRGMSQGLARMKMRLKYLVEDLDRHGNLRRYIRIPGQKKVRLRGIPGTEEFHQEYLTAISGARTHTNIVIAGAEVARTHFFDRRFGLGPVPELLASEDVLQPLFGLFAARRTRTRAFSTARSALFRSLPKSMSASISSALLAGRFPSASR